MHEMSATGVLVPPLFHELMKRRVGEILLVSCPYDAFIMEEDGRLAERIVQEYQGLNLTKPPRLHWASSARECLDRLGEIPVDLVILMPRLGDMAPEELCREIRQRYPQVPVHLLAHEASELPPPSQDPDAVRYDRTFFWRGDTDLLLALIKSAEDRWNAGADAATADIRVILFVEDDPVYRSLVLPFLYKEVVRQTRLVMAEAATDGIRMLKMRSRPKILLAETFEEAEYLAREFSGQLQAVITDARFPRKGVMDPLSGRKLLEFILGRDPTLSCLLFSTEPERAEDAKACGVPFLNKQAPELLADLRFFLLNRAGFGDFLFRMPDGRVVGRAASIRAMAEIFDGLPDASIHHHAVRNDFSLWFAARMEFEMARRVRRVQVEDFSSDRDVRMFMEEMLNRRLLVRKRGVVTDFDGASFDPEADFFRIGKGSLGGKARGLAFLSARYRGDNGGPFSDVRIRIPETIVLTTECFDRFLEENELAGFTPMLMKDADVDRRFAAAKLPESLRRDLILFLSKVRYPLAVRSSGLIEDSPVRPCAGIYRTEMVANCHPNPEIRYRQLEEAVIRVYASLFLMEARVFKRAAFQSSDVDKMAVIIQRVAGTRHGDRFFPAVSGVLQTRNMYPVGRLQAEDGVAHVALGLGKTVVEGGSAIRFSPGSPEFQPQFSRVDDILQHAQRSVFVLSMAEDTPQEDVVTPIPASAVAGIPEFSPLFGWYMPEDHRIRSSLGMGGAPVPTLAGLLTHRMFHFPETLERLMEDARTAMGGPAEMEFSLTLPRPGEDRATIWLLQIRPFALCRQNARVTVSPEEAEGALLFSRQAMGPGQETPIRHLVYVDPASFDPARTREVAGEVAALNAAMGDAGERYLLMGPGRWGTADPWLGIPVRWQDIAHAAVIVETVSDKVHAEASEGTHFFHNLTSLGVAYVTVRKTDAVDWGALGEEKAVKETTFLRQLTFAVPRLFRLDSEGGVAVLRNVNG